MADQNQPTRGRSSINSSTAEQPDPPAPHMQSRIAAKFKHVGGACLHLLARPSTAGPLLLTCICLAIAYKSRAAQSPRRRLGRRGNEEPPRPVLQRSMSLAALHGGHVALQRIIDSQEARLNEAVLEHAETEFQQLLNPSNGRLHFSKLQRVAGKLEMSGKEDQAVVMLTKALKKVSAHEAHELGMLLVEMLIYKGDFDEALRCSCLHDELITDARGPLYKAVIYSLKGDKRAEESYRTFQDIQSRLHWPDAPKEETPLYDVVHDFDKFQIIVKNLKMEIEKAKERKSITRQ